MEVIYQNKEAGFFKMHGDVKIISPVNKELFSLPNPASINFDEDWQAVFDINIEGFIFQYGELFMTLSLFLEHMGPDQFDPISKEIALEKGKNKYMEKIDVPKYTYPEGVYRMYARVMFSYINDKKEKPIIAAGFHDLGLIQIYK